MDRVKKGGYSALIEAAYAIIPEQLHERLTPHFLCGTDAVFAGLHAYLGTVDGRSYRNTAHVAYPHNQTTLAKSFRHPTVVLPGPAKRYRVATVVHELGHVLHGSIEWEHVAQPVSPYAETNWCEAYAEAFTTWLIPGYAVRPDDATLAHFHELAPSTRR